MNPVNLPTGTVLVPVELPHCVSPTELFTTLAAYTFVHPSGARGWGNMTVDGNNPVASEQDMDTLRMIISRECRVVNPIVVSVMTLAGPGLVHRTVLASLNADMPYRYAVSYPTERGFGNEVVDLDRPPASRADIELLCRAIAERNDLGYIPTVLSLNLIAGPLPA